MFVINGFIDISGCCEVPVSNRAVLMVLVVIFDRRRHKFVLMDEELIFLRDDDAADAADVDLSSSS